MKSKLFVIPILSLTFLFSGCGSDNSVDETTTETIEVTTEQTTETTTAETTETVTKTETTTQITIEAETSAKDLESKKQAAIEKDKEIWNTILSSEKTTTLLQEGCTVVGAGQGTFSELYELAEQGKSNQESCFVKLYDLNDENCTEYIEAAQLYVTNAKSIANNVMKAIDKNDPKYFTTATSEIEDSTNYIIQIVAARTKYLSNSGLNDEEIINILSSE